MILHVLERMHSWDPSKPRLHLTGLCWKVGMDPRDGLVRKLLVHTIRLISEFVVSALDRFSRVRKYNTAITYRVRGERLVIDLGLLYE